MHVLVLNPNMTEAVTQRLMDSAAAVAAPATRLSSMTAPRGFPYISNRAEGQIGGAIAIEMLAQRHREVDAAVIAAFGDPGLLGARELFDIPVIGMSEAAMLTACMLGKRFAIVTFAATLANWYEDCVEMHGMSARCAAIRSVDAAFSSVSNVQEEMEARLIALANRAVLEDQADVIILAGAPLAGLARRTIAKIPVPVVDPIAAAVKQAEALVALAPGKALAGGFRRPAAKETHGLDAALAARIAHLDAARKAT